MGVPYQRGGGLFSTDFSDSLLDFFLSNFKEFGISTGYLEISIFSEIPFEKFQIRNAKLLNNFGAV